jgi:hypothetical protein
MFSSQATLRELALALAVVLAVIYVPDAGHGFVKDDFQWIGDARRPLSVALTHTSGFYRPLVTMSFRANDALFGLASYPYGLTNLVLVFACAALMAALGRSFGLTPGASTFGAAAWAFNFHGINMSILWIVASGWMERMTGHQVRRAAVAAVLVLTALIPVYRERNERWVEIADLSRATMAAAVNACATASCDSILLEDDPRSRLNFTSTFGGFDAAARLFLGRDIPTAIVPGQSPRTGMQRGGDCVVHIRLLDDVPHAELEGNCR